MEANAEHYRWVGFRDIRPIPIALALVGESLANTWSAPVLEDLVDDELPAGPASDFPYAGGVPVVSEKAVVALGDLLEQNGELLPTLSNSGTYFVYNVTTMADVLDEQASEIERFASSGRVMNIKAFAFRAKALDSLAIFKIPQIPKPLVLATERLKSEVERSRLTGFVFKPVWSS